MMALIVALLAVDLASSLVYRTNRSATLSVLPGSEARPSFAIVLFPGYGMSGDLAAKSLREHLPADTVVVGVSYAQRGVDLDAIAQSVVAELKRLQPTHVYFYGASMGGLVAEYVTSMYSNEQTGSDSSLILDTAPAGPQDVRRPQVLLDATCYYPGGIVSSWLWSLAARAAPHVPLRGAPLSLAKESRAYGESIGTPALTSQACFIEGAKPVATHSGDFRTFYAQAADAPEHDPLIDTGAAIRHWRLTFPNIQELTVEGRMGAWHVPLVDRPIDIVEVLTHVKKLT